jgi:hypothetical protein
MDFGWKFKLSDVHKPLSRLPSTIVVGVSWTCRMTGALNLNQVVSARQPRLEVQADMSPPASAGTASISSCQRHHVTVVSGLSSTAFMKTAPSG